MTVPDAPIAVLIWHDGHKTVMQLPEGRVATRVFLPVHKPVDTFTVVPEIDIVKGTPDVREFTLTRFRDGQTCWRKVDEQSETLEPAYIYFERVRFDVAPFTKRRRKHS